ncbi:hypothetical protein PQR67_08285 [Paraburkholderia fungorum]|uniref:hypothetical protein n=1 Tax=Paraburkholderia fungorum TaxID=134537 RepID=UPI0038B9431C
MLPTIREHASACAALHCASTPDYAAAALNISRDDAASALRDAASAGLFRRLLLPGLGNAPVYQPTAFAGGLDARRAPKFLRAGLSESGRWRGLLRGSMVFFATSNLEWLTSAAQSILRERFAVPGKGHAEPLIARDDAGRYQLYVPVPPADAIKSSSAVIASAAARWLPLLEHGATNLHFVTLVGRAADALQSALSDLAPPSQNDATRELAALDARIAADGTGVARVQFAHRRAELAAVAVAAAKPAFPWLVSEVVEVRV